MTARLARFAFIMAVAFVLSRVLGLVRDQVILALIGPGRDYDAYLLALQVPDLLFILMSGGAFSAAFIPVFTRLIQSHGDDEAWDMASGVMWTTVSIAVVLILLVWIFAPQIVAYGIARRSHDPYVVQKTTELLRLVVFQPLFLLLASVATAVLQSFDRFLVPAIGPIIYNISIIVSTLLFSRWLGIDAVAIGVVVGAVLFFLIQLPFLLQMGLSTRWQPPFANQHVRRTFILLAPRIVGQAAVQVNTMVALYLAAGLGTGRVTAFRVASLLFALPVSLFGTSVATAAFPALSREAGAMDIAAYKSVLKRAVKGVIFFILPASVGMMLLREPIIALLFERGKFTREDTLLTAQPFFFFAVGMWAYALVDMLPRAFYALQDTLTPLKVALVTVLLDIFVSFILVGPLGLRGLAFAFSLATIVQVLALSYLLRSRVGEWIDSEMINFLLKCCIATVLMGGLLILLRPWVVNYHLLSFPDFLVRLLIVIAVAAGGYLGVSTALGQSEVRVVLNMVLRK
ncbi:integral membrane protein MviN [Thermobaculum terrenum ATCC BAA-798]|uniref:Probable lipid II flippase MurJ n=1 Tax=Thermobaculum terrenum (strain ATCC BAA-798 / CCMEE 7001 / YNP1) TaxID=525904 RepID=D1CCK1_THET1|nr:murein biosynthesis integral membrane protein MurJ [Thermobaculum terrenum]ACZ42516.1 integral membrane protein MviN [Thermobaculum terrenum ATCC BAA-798]